MLFPSCHAFPIFPFHLHFGAAFRATSNVQKLRLPAAYISRSWSSWTSHRDVPVVMTNITKIIVYRKILLSSTPWRQPFSASYRRYTAMYAIILEEELVPTWGTSLYSTTIIDRGSRMNYSTASRVHWPVGARLRSYHFIGSLSSHTSMPNPRSNSAIPKYSNMPGSGSSAVRN